MAKFLGEAGLTALWGKIGSTFIKKDSGTAASPEAVSGVKQFTNGLVLNSGSSWTSSDRAIPFSASGSPQLIQYSDTTLTFNPNTKVLKVDGNEVLHAGNLSSASFADSIPTQGSSRLITSGGMYSVLEELEDTVAASENSLNSRVTVLENTSLTTSSLTNHAKFADTSTADQVLVSKSGGYEWKTLGSNAYNSTAFLTSHQDWNLVASTSSGTSNVTTATTNTTTYLNLIKGSTFDSGIQITGTQNVSVSAISGKITITGPNLSSYLTAHQDWGLVASTSSGTSNATTATTNTTTYLNLIKGSTFDSGIQVTGAQNITVSAISGKLTITGPNLSSYVTGSGLTADKIVLGNGSSTVKTSEVGISTTAPSSSSADTTVPTSKAVNSAISTALGTVAGALKYKGTVASNSALPANHSVGDVYVVSTAGTFVGKACEVGDYIICKTAGTSANNAHWDVLNGENQVSNASASLAAAGSSATIATVDGTDITVTTPSTWTGLAKTGTVTSVTPGTGLRNGTATTAITGSGTLNLISATTGELGGIKAAAVRTATNLSLTTGGTTSGRYYGVELDGNNKAFVNVPWEANTHNSHALTVTNGTASAASGTITYVESVTGCDATTGNLTATTTRKSVTIPTVNDKNIKISDGTNTKTISTGNASADKTLTISASQNITATVGGSDGAATLTLTGPNLSGYSTTSHTHSTTIATDSGTSQLTLAANTKYKLTAGGTSFIFTTPAHQSLSGYSTTSHTHTLSIAADSGTSALTLAANTKYKLTAGGSTFIFTTPAHQSLSGYVKLDAGAAEQTIKSSIGSMSDGVINLWRSNGDYYTFLEFSNGTTETALGGIGFKSQSDHNLYRKDGSTYYKILDESNYNSSSYADTTPTQNSTKLITSGGVYSALNTIETTVAESEDELDSRVTTLENSTVTGSGLTSDKIILGNGTRSIKTSSKGITTTAPSSTSDDTTIPTSKAVNQAITSYKSLEVIKGTQGASTYQWTGVSRLTSSSAFVDGYSFIYWLPWAGTSTSATLTLTFADSSTKTVNVYVKGTTRMTTHYGAGSSMILTYYSAANISGSTYEGVWAQPFYYSTDGNYNVGEYYARYFIYNTSNPLYRYKIFGLKQGKVVPLSITNQSSGTIVSKTPTSLSFEIERGLYYYTTTTAVTATGTAVAAQTTYSHWGAMTTPHYTFNTAVPVYSDVYLVGSLSDDGTEFKLDTTSNTSWYVYIYRGGGTADASNGSFVAGKYYMFVGRSYSSANYMSLEYHNPVYYCRSLSEGGTALIPWSRLEGGTASGSYSHAEGYQTCAEGGASHVEGLRELGDGITYTMTGSGTDYVYDYNGPNHPIVGTLLKYGDIYAVVTSFSEETNQITTDVSLGTLSNAEVLCSGGVALGIASHSEGIGCVSYGIASHAEGVHTCAFGDDASHAEGSYTYADGGHAEGDHTTASGEHSHTEGEYTVASGINSHAEGDHTTASGYNSHAEGYHTTASYEHSHTEGEYTVATNRSEHAEGTYNYSHTSYSNLAESTVHSVGIGSSSTRKNAVEIMRNGDMYIYGVGGYTGSNISTASTLQTILNSSSDPVAITNSEIDTILAS